MVNTITLKNPASAKRYLFMITWPIFIEVFLQILMKLTDVFMLSFVSDQAVAAIGVVNQLMTFMFVLFNFTAMGAGVVVSQYVGANDKNGVRNTIASAITINLLFGVAVSLFVGLNRHFLLNLFSLEPELYAYASSYALIVGSALFAQAMILTISSLLQAMGHTKDVMASVFIMNALNVFGNYVLIFGALGFPRIGVTGVAISTATVRIIIMVGMFILLTKRMPVKMSLSSFFKLKKEYTTKILNIGVPSAGEQLSYNVSQLVLTVMITTLGATALATRVYSQNFMAVLVIFSLSIAKGMQIFIGQLVGAKKQDEAYEYMFMGFKFAGLVTIVIGSIFALFGQQIFSFFTDDPSLIALGSTIMIIELFLQPARTSNLVIISALRAAGDAKFPVMIGVTVMWGVLVPLAYLFGIVLGFGLPGIWFAMLIDEWIRGSFIFFRWKKKRWMNKRLVSPQL
ncbi:MAG: MATE family efflux transporter [Alkalibacterium sp.]|nr:MATE family efflux transporter [Alkalibacterium sp.]